MSKKGKKGQDTAGTQPAARQLEQATRDAVDVIASAEKALAEMRAQQGAGGGGDGVGAAGAAAGGGRADALGAATAAAAAQGYSPVGGRQITGSISQLEVSFPQATAPAPAFAAVAVVHRFPEYVLIDFGSIDPLQVEQTQTGQKALLQHVGRICLPESTAKRLMMDLAGLFGQGAEG